MRNIVWVYVFNISTQKEIRSQGFLASSSQPISDYFALCTFRTLMSSH